MNKLILGSKYLLGGVIGGCVISDTFAKKVDANLVSPFRNYRSTLENPRYWRTSDDVEKLGCEVKEGITRMFKGE